MATLTKKTFIEFADMLAVNMPNPDNTGEYLVWKNMAQHIAEIFAASNGNFDRGKFNTYIEDKAKKLGNL